MWAIKKKQALNKSMSYVSIDKKESDDMQIGISTDKGIKRNINQDYYGVVEGDGNIPYVFIIADGMGGHRAGEVASKLSVEICISYIRKHINNKLTKEEILEKLKEMAKFVNEQVYKESNENKENYGMGTTLTIAIVMKEYVIISHIGDSRVYILRDNQLKRITVDHSYVEELVRNGTITEKEAKKHPRKNVLTRAVGYFKNVEADLYIQDIKEGDVFLMCTDGLTNMVDEGCIKDLIKEQDKLQDVADSLIKMTNANGGKDNTTIIVFKNEVEKNAR